MIENYSDQQLAEAADEHAETLYDTAGNPVKTTVWGIRSTELCARNEARLEAFTEVVEALGLDKATELVQVISGGDDRLAADLRFAWIRTREESAPKTARPDWNLPPFEIRPREDGSGFDVTDGLASFWALTREEAETVAAAANENRTQR